MFVWLGRILKIFYAYNQTPAHTSARLHRLGFASLFGSSVATLCAEDFSVRGTRGGGVGVECSSFCNIRLGVRDC